MRLAAFTDVRESVADPSLYYATDVLGNLALLDAMRECDLDIFIFSSGCATYGLPITSPITEQHPQDPINPYGANKLMAEQMIRGYGAAYGLRWMILRYFNAAGADPDDDLGECHDPETHAAPLAILAALAKSPPFNHYGTADGSAIRGYIHVGDLASAHVAAFKHPLDGGSSDALNLGTGTGTSVLELITAVERIGARPVPTVRCPRRAGDPPILVAAAGRARGPRLAAVLHDYRRDRPHGLALAQPIVERRLRRRRATAFSDLCGGDLPTGCPACRCVDFLTRSVTH
jgi:UDP-arabinose 4-epimerase